MLHVTQTKIAVLLKIVIPLETLRMIKLQVGPRVFILVNLSFNPTFLDLWVGECASQKIDGFVHCEQQNIDFFNYLLSIGSLERCRLNYLVDELWRNFHEVWILAWISGITAATGLLGILDSKVVPIGGAIWGWSGLVIMLTELNIRWLNKRGNHNRWGCDRRWIVTRGSNADFAALLWTFRHGRSGRVCHSHLPRGISPSSSFLLECQFSAPFHATFWASWSYNENICKLITHNVHNCLRAKVCNFLTQ